MRVLTFTTLFPNSIEPNRAIFVYQRIAHLAHLSDNSVRVVAPIPHFPSTFGVGKYRKLRQIPLEEQFGGISVWHPRHFLIPRISMPWHGVLMYRGSLPLVRRLHRETPFDCIDAHYVYPDGFAAVRLGKALGLPVIVTARGTDITEFPSLRLIRPMVQETLVNAAGVISVCQALKNAIVELGIPPSRIAVIGNGVALERFQPVDRSAARRKLGMPTESRIVVAVGSLRPVKGFQFLIPAVAQLLADVPRLRLYIVGEGEYRPKLESLIRELKLEQQVILAGAQPNEDLKYWYSAADISCLASSREGWPNVLLESLACGTPVLATKVWGVPEVISSPDVGLLVEQNVESIMCGLRAGLAKQWDREKLLRHARRRTWDTVAAELDSYLRVCVPRTV